MTAQDLRDAPRAAGPTGTRPDRPRITVRPAAVAAWAILALLVATGPLPAAAPDESAAAYLAAGGLGAAAVLGALVLAQLGRARALQRQGIRVDGIDLGFFGSRIAAAGEPTTPAGLRAAGRAGPLATGAATAGLLALAGVLSLLSGAAAQMFAVTALWSAGATMLLTLVDLLPSPGTSGGRLALARAWRRDGTRMRAEVEASRIGVRSAWAVLAAGFVLTLLVGVVGIWVLLAGGLIMVASRAELAGASMRQAVRGLSAGDVMSPAPPQIHPWTTVQSALTDVALPTRATVLTLREPTAGWSGLVPLGRLAAVPADDRDLVRVARLAVPPDAVPTVSVDEPLEAAIERLTAAPLLGLVIVLGRTVQGGAVIDGVLDPTLDPSAGEQVPVGVITAADLARAVQTAPLRGVSNPMGVRR